MVTPNYLYVSLPPSEWDMTTFTISNDAVHFYTKFWKMYLGIDCSEPDIRKCFQLNPNFLQ